MRVRYKNTSFLAEVLVNIVVFSIACAILVGAFVQASIMVRQTREESLAANELYALTETLKLRGAESLEYTHLQEDGSLRIEYDENWMPMNEGQGTYYVRMEIVHQPRATGDMLYVSLWAYQQNGEEISRLDTIVYQPQKVVHSP